VPGREVGRLPKTLSGPSVFCSRSSATHVFHRDCAQDALRCGVTGGGR
jgi:hypothetical protein